MPYPYQRGISIRGDVYDRLLATCRARGVSISSVVTAMVERDTPAVVDPGERLPVSDAMHRRIRGAARRGLKSTSAALERAILLALDDAEQWPTVVPRRRRAPMVAHTRRP